MAGSGTPGIPCSAGNRKCPRSERPGPGHLELPHTRLDPAPSHSRDKPSPEPNCRQEEALARVQIPGMTRPSIGTRVQLPLETAGAGQGSRKTDGNPKYDLRKKPDGASKGAPRALPYLLIPSLRTSPIFSPASRDRPRELLPPPSRRSDPGGIGDVPDTPGALGAAPGAAAEPPGARPGSAHGCSRIERRRRRERATGATSHGIRAPHGQPN